MSQDTDDGMTTTFQPVDSSSLESINNEVETLSQPLANDRPTNYIAPSDGDLSSGAGECILVMINNYCMQIASHSGFFKLPQTFRI